MYELLSRYGLRVEYDHPNQLVSVLGNQWYNQDAVFFVSHVSVWTEEERRKEVAKFFKACWQEVTGEGSVL
jgi:hypothetical protein